MEEIVRLAAEYFETVERYEAETRIDSSGQLAVGTGMKMQNDWQALRVAVDKHRVAAQQITAPDRLRSQAPYGGG